MQQQAEPIANPSSVIPIAGSLWRALFYRNGAAYVAFSAVPLDTAPLAARLLAGVAGLLLLFAGARVYRLAVVAPGVIAGVGGGVLLARALELGGAGMAAAALSLAVVGGVVCHLTEKAAVVIAGVVGGALAGDALSAHALAPLVGAGVGALLFPALYRRALVVVTSLLGAVTLVAAVGTEHEPVAVVGVAIAGALVQFAWGRPSKDG